MLVDSHAHLNFKAFDEDLAAVVGRCQAKQMKVINVGTQFNASLKAIKIANDYDGFFAAVGLHPIHLGEYRLDPMEEDEQRQMLSPEEEFAKVSALVGENKVVAVGETGLDYFRLEGNQQKVKQDQQDYFVKHLELAQKNDLPVILHCRGSEGNPSDAYLEVLEMVRGRGLRGVIHCFGANWEVAEQFAALGLLVGFTGIITFKKKVEELQKLVRLLPLSSILIETDSPYLAPEPYRGGRNEPAYVEEVAKKVAEIKGLRFEQAVEVTTANAHKLFNI